MIAHFCFLYRFSFSYPVHPCPCSASSVLLFFWLLRCTRARVMAFYGVTGNLPVPEECCQLGQHFLPKLLVSVDPCPNSVFFRRPQEQITLVPLRNCQLTLDLEEVLSVLWQIQLCFLAKRDPDITFLTCVLQILG